MPKLRGIQLRVQRVDRVLRRVDVRLLGRRGHRQDILLLGHPQHLQLLGVALFDRGQQGPAKALHLRGVLPGFLDQIGETIGWNIAAGRALDIVQRKPRRGCFDQHHRVDRRREQRQLTQRTGDVHAVADLVEAILDQIPIAEQIGVRRHAEGRADMPDHRRGEFRRAPAGALRRLLSPQTLLCLSARCVAGSAVMGLPVKGMSRAPLGPGLRCMTILSVGCGRTGRGRRLLLLRRRMRPGRRMRRRRGRPANMTRHRLLAVVVRDLGIYHILMLRPGTGLRARSTSPGMGVGLHLHQEIRAFSERSRDRFVGSLVLVCLAAIPDHDGAGSQNFQRPNVKQRRLVHGLHLEFGKQSVAPFNQHIDIVHHDAFLIGAQPQARDRMRIERVLFVGFDRRGVGQDFAKTGHIQSAKLDEAPDPILCGLGAGPRQEIAKLLLGLLPIFPLAVLVLDFQLLALVLLLHIEQIIVIGGRIEYVTVPLQRCRKILLAVELIGDQERCVEEYLAKIRSHGSREIHFFPDHLVLDMAANAQSRGILAKRELAVQAQQAIDTAGEQRTAELLAQGRRQTLHDEVAGPQIGLQQKQVAAGVNDGVGDLIRRRTVDQRNVRVFVDRCDMLPVEPLLERISPPATGRLGCKQIKRFVGFAELVNVGLLRRDGAPGVTIQLSKGVLDSRIYIGGPALLVPFRTDDGLLDFRDAAALVRRDSLIVKIDRVRAHLEIAAGQQKILVVRGQSWIDIVPLKSGKRVAVDGRGVDAIVIFWNQHGLIAGQREIRRGKSAIEFCHVGLVVADETVLPRRQAAAGCRQGDNRGCGRLIVAAIAVEYVEIILRQVERLLAIVDVGLAEPLVHLVEQRIQNNTVTIPKHRFVGHGNPLRRRPGLVEAQR